MMPIRIMPPVTGIQYFLCLRENGRARSFATSDAYHGSADVPVVLLDLREHPVEAAELDCRTAVAAITLVADLLEGRAAVRALRLEHHRATPRRAAQQRPVLG